MSGSNVEEYEPSVLEENIGCPCEEEQEETYEQYCERRAEEEYEAKQIEKYFEQKRGS